MKEKLRAHYPEFQGRVAFITGAASGIGLETARRFAELGSKVVMADIAHQRLVELEREMKGLPGAVYPVQLDVTDADATIQAVEQTVEAHGQVDILVCCAGGVGKIASIEDTTAEDWTRMIHLNLSSVFYGFKAVSPHMKRQRFGRVVAVASVAGRTVQTPLAPHYAAAKAGVIRLVQHFAREMGPYQVTVNAIAPGTTETERVKNLRTAEQNEREMAQIALGRFAKPQEQVDAITFLCSDGASYITGATLDVNGGKAMI